MTDQTRPDPPEWAFRLLSMAHPSQVVEYLSDPVVVAQLPGTQPLLNVVRALLACWGGIQADAAIVIGDRCIDDDEIEAAEAELRPLRDAVADLASLSSLTPEGDDDD